ncbi:hypothetical protein VCSRO34_3127 [Vibrio cholerae]|nr:hypothetical protein VCSRO34_3127 [Vibrio cholerae]
MRLGLLESVTQLNSHALGLEPAQENKEMEKWN